MQNRMSVSKYPHENMALQPQQKSAWFEFVKVYISVSLLPTRPNSPRRRIMTMVDVLLVNCNIQRRLIISYCTAFSPLSSIRDRILRILGRTPISVRCSSQRNRSREARAVGIEVVPQYIEAAA